MTETLQLSPSSRAAGRPSARRRARLERAPQLLEDMSFLNYRLAEVHESRR